MREIACAEISQTVARLCQEANYYLGEDVVTALRLGLAAEESPLGREVLKQLLDNAEIAGSEQVPLCQDTGLTVLFLDLGQDIHIVDGDLGEALAEGVRRGYGEGYLRKSLVWPPIFGRKNTQDNTPPVVHTEVVPGDRLTITVLPKGAGSENMSRLFMLTPSDGVAGVKRAVLKAVDEAGPNPCPPIIVGVGIGGTAEHVGYLAKRALLREIGRPSADPRLAELEAELLAEIRDLGIGPAGFGGRMTALAVHVEMAPCHIASLPVGVNIQCHSARHKTAVL
ncbi:MAG: fumarate hydratase [Chloroflexi bacterium]|nr:fumarate hydratase [Chloroflexota bacterium]MCL5110058.1 fumarate hydratase [Chloroflexota bacterium]